MKIDLSKYPPGTKFQLKNGETVILVGKSQISNDYLVEYIRDKYHISDGPAVTYRRQNGTAAVTTDKYDIESVVQSVIQPDRYLVSFLRKDGTVDTTVVTNPTEFTPEHFLLMCLRNESIYGLFNIDESIPDKVLSWSKIEA